MSASNNPYVLIVRLEGDELTAHLVGTPFTPLGSLEDEVDTEWAGYAPGDVAATTPEQVDAVLALGGWRLKDPPNEVIG